jgi:hypothetical protein
LSLLWAAFFPGTIATVARGIKHSWSPTHVSSLNEISTGPAARPSSKIWFEKAKNIYEYPWIYHMYINQMVDHVYHRPQPAQAKRPGSFRL